MSAEPIQVRPEMQIRWRAGGTWNYGAIVGQPMPEVYDVLNSWGLAVRLSIDQAEAYPHASHPLAGRWIIQTGATQCC